MLMVNKPLRDECDILYITMSAADNGSPEREPVVIDLRDGFGTLAGAVRQVVGHLRLIGVYDPQAGPAERPADATGLPTPVDGSDGTE